jgi:hypothetical protein
MLFSRTEWMSNETRHLSCNSAVGPFGLPDSRDILHIKVEVHRIPSIAPPSASFWKVSFKSCARNRDF